MTNRRIFLLIVLSLATFGCKTPTHKLNPEWRPLKEIKEAPRLVRQSISDGAIATIGDTAYVRNLDNWLRRNPIDSIAYDSTLAHERIHSIRQRDLGLTLWLAQYSYDKDFALLEEKIGWYHQIKTVLDRSASIDIERVAQILSKYKNLRGSLISYEDAKNWVTEVVRGNWTPPE